MSILNWIVAIFERGIPAMGFLILAGLIIIFFITLAVTNKTKVHTIIFLSIIGFYLFVKVCCGPSYFDAKVMQPMAEKISAYIVKNGVPESLKDITDLPYGLKGCKKETTYGPSVKTYFYEGAQWKENMEICNFKNITIRFSLSKRLKEKNAKWAGSLRMSSSAETTLYSSIEQDKDNKFTFNNIRFSGKHSGICQSLRQ